MLTLSGWREWRRRFMGSVRSMYTLAKLRKHLKPWSLPQFKVRASLRCGSQAHVSHQEAADHFSSC